MKKIKFGLLTTLLVMLFSITAFASVKYETVKWPSDKNYDANIFVADPSPELKQALDDVYAQRQTSGTGSTGDNTTQLADQYKALYTAIQPVDYLQLGGTTILQDPVASYINSSGEAVGVWNLPVLQDGYYYQLAANNWITMPDYTYPVLALKKKPDDGQNVKVYLRVYPRKSENNASAVAQFIITIPWNLSVKAVEEPRMSDAGTLEVAQATAHSTSTNIHSWAFSYSGTFRPYQTKFAVFGEDYVVALTEEPSSYQYYELENGQSLIMSRKTSEQSQITYYGDTVVFEKGFLDASSMQNATAGNQDLSADLDMDILNMWRDETDSRVTYALGPKQDIVTGTVNSTHSSWHVKTKSTNAYERKNGAMAAFFTKERCHIVVYYPGTITDPYLGMYDVSEDNRTYLKSGEIYSLRQETGDYFLSLVVDNPNTQIIDARDIEDAKTDNYTYAATNGGEPGIKLKDGATLKYYHNLSAISFWNAWMPTVGAIDAYDSERTCKINLDANGGEVSPSVIEIISTSHEHINLPTPKRDKYKFIKWVWKDTNTTFDETDFTPVAGETYDLKAVWEKVDGQYSITFVNDLKNTTEKRIYYINGNPPTLPENPVGDKTHTFRNWIVLDPETGERLAIYSPSTFTPEDGKNYKFLTNWDSRGVITDILLRNTEFYVGDTISKNSIRVTVTDDYGNTRVLGTEEFSINPNTYDTAGWHTPTVLYTQGNATATFDVEFKEDKVKSLTAEWKGRDLPVGTKIDKDFIKVGVTFESGRTKDEKDAKFSFAPQRIQKEGSNKITVSAYGKTTNLTINGKKSNKPELEGPSGNNRGDLDSIEVTYTGPTVAPGAPINRSDFEVKRIYEDGTTNIVPTANILISPAVAGSAPSTTVTVYYDGYTDEVDVPTGDDGANELTENYRDDNFDAYNGENFDPDALADDSTEILEDNTGYANMSSSTTSSYYLHGRNVFDDFMSYGSSQPMNEVDIQQVLNDIPDGTEEHTIALVNKSIGDQLTPSILSQLRDKGTVIKLNMNDDNGQPLITWTIDPNAMDDVDMQSDFDPNVEVIQYPRTTDEVCVGYSVTNYPSFASLSANLAPFGVDDGRQIEYYHLDTADWTPLDTVSHNTITTGTLASFGSPDTYFAVTTKTDEFYPEDYNLYNEYPWPSEQAAMIATDEELSNEMTNNEEDLFTDNQQQEQNFSGQTDQPIQEEKSLFDRIRIPLMILLGIIILAGAGFFVLSTIKRRSIKANNTIELEEVEEDELEEYDEEEDEEIFDEDEDIEE